MKAKTLALLVAVAVVAAYVMFTAPKMLPQQPATAPAEKPRNATVALRVHGVGALLVNGSSYVNTTLTLRVPAVLAINASAPKGWRLKTLMVNGSPVLPGVAKVYGNTTVEAVFERVFCTVYLRANVEGAGARVNGSLYRLPASVEVPCPSTVLVEPVAPGGYRPVNSSAALEVSSNSSLLLVFERSRRVARFVNVRVPVSLNGTVYAGDFEVGFEGVLRLNLSPYGVDDAGCVPFNETVKVCLEGWRRLSTNQTLRARWLALNLSDSEVFEQVWGYAPAKLEGAVIELIAGNTTVKTVAQPSKMMVVPFRAVYKYLGNGWFWVNGSDWVFYISMPPWKKIKVELNYTAWGGAWGRLAVVVRNDNLYFDVGAALGNTPTLTCVIDRGIIDLFYPWTFKSEDEINRLFIQTDYSKYFSCATWERRTAAGPSLRVEPGMKQGDLRFDGTGEAYIRITILEQP
ncbi:hypothetical protein [Thermofilum pendens]|nr:hypothetical protein [Thermofilum pendens]